MKSLPAPCDKTGFFPFLFAPRGLVSSLRLSAPLVFSSPPLGEITERESRLRKDLFPQPASVPSRKSGEPRAPAMLELNEASVAPTARRKQAQSNAPYARSGRGAHQRPLMRVACEPRWMQ